MNADLQPVRSCAVCGTPLTPHTLEGLCPRCLLRETPDQTPLTQPAEPEGPGATALPTPLRLPGVGARLGRYRLLQQIGEGGFGVVYLAEQEEPVRRRVALKILKEGMDTRQVIARFEAERQALALMDHPSIAKVLDAGATDTGRPYFVMELVPGLKITEYCDQHQLPAKKRLQLFQQVCHAVQHAHQKGIIHRDLKPSNILVAAHDGVPVPKIIDFGVAKAIAQRLTEKTLFTAFAQMIGTPAYMSPEQATLASEDIDTRSDIYSLGVLLYELLTGRPPFEPDTLLRAGLDEIRRILREVDPPKPSTRLTTLANDDLARIARFRQSEPPKLLSLVRGDLDWIVMKALEKDRDQRYETADALALDVQRHLQQEPVLAAAPSRLYRIRKFARRNRVLLGAVTMIAVVLIAGAVVSTLLAVDAMRARRLAEQAVAGIIQAFGNYPGTPVLADALARAGEAGLAPYLNWLRDTDPKVRANAAETIGQILGAHRSPALARRVAAPLLAALADQNLCVREAAAVALDPVVTSLQDARVRNDVVAALLATLKPGERPPPGTTAPASADEPRLRRHAVSTLRHLLLAGPVPTPARRLLAEQLVAPFLDCLRDDDLELRKAAAFGMQHVVPLVDEPATRALIAKALVQAVKEQAVAPILAEPLAQIGASDLEMVLDLLETETATGLLREHVQPESPAERVIHLMATSETMVGFGVLTLRRMGRSAVEPLSRALGDADRKLRKVAAIAMQELLRVVKHPTFRAQALGPLVHALDDPNAEVSGYATAALLNTGLPLDMVVTAIEQAEPSQERIHGPSDTTVTDRLLRLMATVEKDSIWGFGTAALGQMREPDLVSLIRALTHPDHRMRRASAAALGCVLPRFQDPAARNTALEPLARLLEDPNSEVRIRAQWALQEMRTPEAEAVLRQAAVQPEP